MNDLDKRENDCGRVLSESEIEAVTGGAIPLVVVAFAKGLAGGAAAAAIGKAIELAFE
jgi:lactobin A/cerein 7B family class IIb bacteriocin